MDVFVQLLVNGVTLGSVYALIALGYSLVYGVLKLLNFAHGEVYMVGAFVGYGVLQALGGPADLVVPVGAAIALMFLGAMTGAGILGFTIERFAYRPLRNSPRIAPLISALGVSFFLQASALLLLGANIRSYSTPEMISPRSGIHWGPLNVSVTRLLVMGLAVVMMIGLHLFVVKTRTGRAMRAVAYDREAAAMMGIDVDRVISITFIVGSALAGAAGVMVGLAFGRIYHMMGLVAGLKGFTAAVVGGIGSIPGAMLGGLVIGLAEAFTGGYLSSTFQDIIVFTILIVVMLVRPRGLLGRREVKKV